MEQQRPDDSRGVRLAVRPQILCGWRRLPGGVAVDRAATMGYVAKRSLCHEYRAHHQRHLALGPPRRERQHLDSHAQPGPAGGAERGVRAGIHRLLPHHPAPHRHGHRQVGVPLPRLDPAARGRDDRRRAAHRGGLRDHADRRHPAPDARRSPLRPRPHGVEVESRPGGRPRHHRCPRGEAAQRAREDPRAGADALQPLPLAAAPLAHRARYLRRAHLPGRRRLDRAQPRARQVLPVGGLLRSARAVGSAATLRRPVRSRVLRRADRPPAVRPLRGGSAPPRRRSATPAPSTPAR